MSGACYVLLDGDRVGDAIDGHYLRNDAPGLYLFARKLDDAVASLANTLKGLGATIYLAGGDNILGSVEDLEKLLQLVDAARPNLPVTFSIGVGDDARGAYLALKVAKASGPGSTVRAEQRDGGLRFVLRAADGGWTDA